MSTEKKYTGWIITFLIAVVAGVIVEVINSGKSPGLITGQNDNKLPVKVDSPKTDPITNTKPDLSKKYIYRLGYENQVGQKDIAVIIKNDEDEKIVKILREKFEMDGYRVITNLFSDDFLSDGKFDIVHKKGINETIKNELNLANFVDYVCSGILSYKQSGQIELSYNVSSVSDGDRQLYSEYGLENKQENALANLCRRLGGDYTIPVEAPETTYAGGSVTEIKKPGEEIVTVSDKLYLMKCEGVAGEDFFPTHKYPEPSSGGPIFYNQPTYSVCPKCNGPIAPNNSGYRVVNSKSPSCENYGHGNGLICVYTECCTCIWRIHIENDNDSWIGTTNYYFNSPPDCGQKGTVSAIVNAGKHRVYATDENNNIIIDSTVSVSSGKCLKLNFSKYPGKFDNRRNTTVQSYPFGR